MSNLPNRANRIDNGELVYGYHVKVQGKHYIVPEDAELVEVLDSTDKAILGGIKVKPSTLAMNTGVDAKNGRVFGSFEVDGLMSDGGDRIKFSYVDYGINARGRVLEVSANIIYQNGGYILNYVTEPAFHYTPISKIMDMEGLEIIPPTGEGVKGK